MRLQRTMLTQKRHVAYAQKPYERKLQERISQQQKEPVGLKELARPYPNPPVKFS